MWCSRLGVLRHGRRGRSAEVTGGPGVGVRGADAQALKSWSRLHRLVFVRRDV